MARPAASRRRARFIPDSTMVRTRGVDSGVTWFMDRYAQFHELYHRGEVYDAVGVHAEAFRALVLLLGELHSVKTDGHTLPLIIDELPERVGNQVLRLGPTEDVNECNSRLSVLYQLLLDELQRSRADSSTARETAVRLGNKVGQRYPKYLRWRDIATSPWISPRRIYRTASLDKGSPEDLVKWLGLFGVRTIVDFRTDHERRDSGYSKVVLGVVSYKTVPIWPKVSPSFIQGRHGRRADGMLHFYRHLVNQPNFHETLRNLFAVLEDGTNYPMVMHCHAGVDRTGMVAALLQATMRVPGEVIVRDYLQSSAHTQGSYIRAFLKNVQNEGGALRYLRGAGVPVSSIRRTIENLSLPRK